LKPLFLLTFEPESEYTFLQRMKQRRHLFILLFGLLTLISFSGCFQYPEGPVFTLQLKDERVSGTWLLTNVTDASGADITNSPVIDTIIDTDTISSYPYQNSTLTVIVDRSGNRSWAQFHNGELQTHATFQFADHSNYLIVEYDVIVPNNVVLQVFYDVLKLTDKEFKYIDEKGNTLDYKKY